MSQLAKQLAWAGAAIAGPAFLFNFAAHGATMPGPDDVDRADGAFSLMFMAGVALIVAALWLVRPKPLGRKGRYLLGLESVMVVMAASWAAAIVVDPGNVDSNHPLILVGDACWPLHQALMLFIGIAAVRGGSWPKPQRYAFFGPAAGVAVLTVGVITGIDIIAASALGAGWAIVSVGIITMLRRNEVAMPTEQREFALST